MPSSVFVFMAAASLACLSIAPSVACAPWPRLATTRHLNSGISSAPPSRRLLLLCTYGRDEGAVNSVDVPAEVRDDPKFVRINDEDPRYGPAAILLVGFNLDEIPKVRQFLKDIDGEFVKLLVCTQDMLTRTLWNCLNVVQPANLSTGSSEIARGVARVCFLSGMSGEEMLTIVNCFPELGLEPNVFAALVPKNADSPLLEVMEEVIGDHERLSKGSK